MKLKQALEDFFVEEQIDLNSSAEGDYALYRLDKRGWTTPDALLVVRKRWQLDARRVSFGGLKDRHAHTVQYFTIQHGPQRQLTHQGIHVQYLGRASQPFTSAAIHGNRFRLVLRALTPNDVDHARRALEEVRTDGVPNYFDDQRFGSVSDDEFVAKALVQGNLDRALWLALAAPYEHDRAGQKREKAVLRAHWGQWAACRDQLPRGHARDLVGHLARYPEDLRGAVARLRPELRGLYLSAFQSHLWNRMLARWLRDHLRAEQLIDMPLRLGPAAMHRQLDDEQRAALAGLELPLPTSRGTVDPEDPRTRLMQQILAEEGLTREQMKVQGLREVFFSRGDRSALCLPAELDCEVGTDSHNPGHFALTLRFSLPRGCYATLIVKRITASV